MWEKTEDGPKYFMLAGPWTEKEKEESSQKIRSLGGQMLDGVQWDQRCTHVIAKTYVMSEKIMGALAAGRWVVTKRFLERSVSRNTWQNERPFLSDDAVLRHRRLWSETRGGVFRGLKVVFLMDDEKSEEVKKEVYTRIVEAGGGQVDKSYSLKTLKTKMPRSSQVTHVVVDPSILEDKHPHFNEFKLWREYAATQKWPHNQLFYLHYKFFTDKIKEHGNKQVTEESWSIFKPETQASAKKLREPSQPKRAGSGLAQRPNKKQRTSGGREVVVISDGEASDDDDVQYLENKYAEETRNGYNRRNKRKKTIGQTRRLVETYREQSARGRATRNIPDVIDLDVECIDIDVDVVPPSVASASTSRNTQEHEVINLDSDSDNETTLNEIEEEDSLENQFSWHQPCAIPIHHRPSGMEVDRDERNDNSDDEIEMTYANVSVDTESANENKNSERDIFTQITDDELDIDESDTYSLSDVEESLDDNLKLFPLACDSPIALKSPPGSSNIRSSLSVPVHLPVEPVEDQHSVSSNETSRMPNIEPLIKEDVDIVKSVQSKSRDPPYPFTPTPEKEGSLPGSSTSEFHILKSGICMQPSSTLGGNSRIQQIEDVLNKASQSEDTREQESISDHSDEEVFSIISTTEEEIQSVTSSAEESEAPLSKVDRPQDTVVKDQNVCQADRPQDAVVKQQNEEYKMPIISFSSVPVQEHPIPSLDSLTAGNSSKEKSPERISFSGAEKSPKETPSKIVTNVIEKPSETVPNMIEKSPIRVRTEDQQDVIRPKVKIAEKVLSSRMQEPPEQILSSRIQEPPEQILSSRTQGPPPKVNSKLDGLLHTLLNRQFESDECISISNITSRTEKFDKAGEVPAKKLFKIRQMDGKIREEMLNKFEIEAENRNFDEGTRKRNKNDDLDDDLFNMVDEEKIGEYDLLKSLLMAKFETNLHRYPGSAILNCIIKHYFLMAKSKTVIREGFAFMKKFLFLHSGRDEEDRLRWLELILSAMRDCQVISPFPEFSINNSSDIYDCWRFFRSILNKTLSSTSKEDSCNDDLDLGSEQVEEGKGAAVLLTLLVDTMQKDFEIWSKHLRKTEIAGKLTQPLIFYLLGGEKDFDKNRSKAIVLFYSNMVRTGRDTEEARKMVAMVALLTSHRDSLDGGTNAQLYKGQKLQLADAVAKGLKEAELDENQLFIELSLLQPNWFSALVSKAYCKPTVKLDRLEDLIHNLQSLSLKDPNTTPCVENWVHRSCGFLHWHTLFKANWHFNKYPDKEFLIFRDMNKVQSSKSSPRNVIKFENHVHVSVKHIVDDIKVMRDLHGKKELEKDVGALSSLFFKMKDLYLY